MNDDLIKNAFEYYNNNIIQYTTFIGGFGSSSFDIPYMHSVGEYKLNVETGDLISMIDFNESAIDVVLDEIKINEFYFTDPFYINSNLINNNKVVSFIKEMYDKNIITNLIITGDDFSLNEETYNKYSFLDKIIVDKCDESLKNNNIILNNKSFEFANGYYKKDEDTFVGEYECFIKNDLTDKELNEIVNEMNSSNVPSKKLSFKFYNPALYADLIKRFNDAGLKENIPIEILGYPLTETASVFENIKSVSNDRQIEVTYSCCHDLIAMYTNPPFFSSNSYFSDIEPGGKTKLDVYTSIISKAENFEKQTSSIKSNLEKTILARKYIFDNYAYVSKEDFDNKSIDNYQDLDKIINSDEAICFGLANLFTLFCRRVNIPMFTYGAPGHEMNIARILEEDNNGNVILDKITTFDITNDAYYYDYENGVKVKKACIVDHSLCYFGLDPEKWLLNDSYPTYLTLANSLAITKDEFEKYGFNSFDPVASTYEGFYNSRSFTYSLLHLMGYNYDENKDNIDDVIATLHEEGRIGDIPKDLLISTYRNIIEKKYINSNNGSMIADQIQKNIEKSFEIRDKIFNGKVPQIINGQNDDAPLVSIETYSIKMPEHKKINLDFIDTKPVKYQDDTPVITKPLSNGVIHEEENNNSIASEVINEILNDIINDTSILSSSKELTLVKDVSEELVVVKDKVETLVPINKVSEELVPINSGYITHIMPIDNTKLEDEFIVGTCIKKPRDKDNNESFEDYIDFLNNYYSEYLPKAHIQSDQEYNTNGLFSLTKDKIIQDITIKSFEEQVFLSKGMSDEEILDSQEKIGKVR